MLVDMMLHDNEHNIYLEWGFGYLRFTRKYQTYIDSVKIYISAEELKAMPLTQTMYLSYELRNSAEETKTELYSLETTIITISPWNQPYSFFAQWIIENSME